MSCNRENVIWQSENGKWHRGFFDFYPVGDDMSEDWDYEWDVEYDFTRFNWTSLNHPSKGGAERSWDGANPGGWWESPWSDETAETNKRYNEMAGIK